MRTKLLRKIRKDIHLFKQKDSYVIYIKTEWYWSFITPFALKYALNSYHKLMISNSYKLRKRIENRKRIDILKKFNNGILP
jgi:hypothetical protein